MEDANQMTVCVLDLQDGLQRFSPPSVHAVVWFPPALNRAELCNHWDMVELMACDF